MKNWKLEDFLGALVAVAFVGFLFWASWQSPLPPPNKIAIQTTQQTTQQEHKQSGAEEEIALYTLWLALFTGALVIVSAIQIFFLIRADKTTRIAADAADRSARAAIGIELPIIRISPDVVGSGDTTDGDKMIVSYWVGSVIFSNLGRTKAFPIEIKCGMTCSQKLPSEPHYSSIETFLPNLIFEPDPKITPRKNLSDCSVIIQEGDGDRVYKGTLGLWFYCCLVYEDFMQTRHEAAFCWKWTNIGGGMAWRSDSTPAYNRKT